MLSFMSTLKRRTAESMVRCCGIGIEAAASMSTTGVSGVGCSGAARIFVQASSRSLRNWSASSECCVGRAACCAAGTGCGAGAVVTQATEYNATAVRNSVFRIRTPSLPSRRFDFQVDRDALHIRGVAELQLLLSRLDHVCFVVFER